MRTQLPNVCLAAAGTAASWLAWLMKYEAETRLVVTLLGGVATIIAIVNGVRTWFRKQREE